LAPGPATSADRVEATIWRIVKRAGLITPEPKKKPKAAYLSFAAEQPNEMWQVDFTHYRLTRAEGTPGGDVEILCFLDDHSRYAISVTCHQPVTRSVVVAVFRQAVADQGIPASVLSDNGMVFTTRFPAAVPDATPSTASKPNYATWAWCRSTPGRTIPPPAAKWNASTKR
jgi:transposase InsO family protein